MNYLATLKQELINRFDSHITPENISIFLVNGDFPSQKTQVSYVVRILFIDFRYQNPFDVLGFVRQWFYYRRGYMPSISFSSEVIDKETYDWEIDVNITDSVAIADDGTTKVCDPVEWSVEQNKFVPLSELNTGVASDFCGCD